MKYQMLGRTGLRVSEVCLGAMTFGTEWGAGAEKPECRRMFDTFAGAGGNFVDTAVNYTEGTSEAWLGEFLDGRRDQFVVATKYTGTRADQSDPNQGGNSRKNLRQSLERSLKRLKTDYIDLYYLHVWDNLTPVDEVLGTLDALVREGKVRYLGISDTPAWIVAEGNTLAEARGWERWAALQLPYSLAWRDAERAELPMAHRWDMSVLTWAVLDGGHLSGKYGRGETGRRGSDPISPAKQAVIDAVESLAADLGKTPSQVALNWVRQQTLARMIPLIGARTLPQIQDNLAALDWSLTPDQWASLASAGPIDLGFPRSLIEGGLRPYVFGATFDQTTDHRQGLRT